MIIYNKIFKYNSNQTLHFKPLSYAVILYTNSEKKT